MKNRYSYELIRDYLHGLTDQKTSNEIKQLIATDEIVRGIAEGIIVLETRFNDIDNDVDSYLENFGQRQLETIERHSKNKKVKRKLWFRMAAAVLLLVSASIATMLMMTTSDIQSMIDSELKQPYPESGLLRSENQGSSKEIGFQLYAQGDFVNASLYFEKAQSEEKENAGVVFYNALSYLYVGNYSKAVTLLSSDIVINSRYHQQAQWFNALALMKSKNETEARDLLIDISQDEQHFKREVALKILDEME